MNDLSCTVRNGRPRMQRSTALCHQPFREGPGIERNVLYATSYKVYTTFLQRRSAAPTSRFGRRNLGRTIALGVIVAIDAY